MIKLSVQSQDICLFFEILVYIFRIYALVLFYWEKGKNCRKYTGSPLLISKFLFILYKFFRAFSDGVSAFFGSRYARTHGYPGSVSGSVRFAPSALNSLVIIFVGNGLLSK